MIGGKVQLGYEGLRAGIEKGQAYAWSDRLILRRSRVRQYSKKGNPLTINVRTNAQK